MRKVLWIFLFSNLFLLLAAVLLRPGAGLDLSRIHVRYHLAYVLVCAFATLTCWLGLRRRSQEVLFAILAACITIARAFVFRSQPLSSWPGGDDGPGLGWLFYVMPATFWIGVSGVIIFGPLVSRLLRARKARAA